MLVISTRPSARRLTGWLAPRWPWCIFAVLRADREAEQLVAEADAEQRLAGLQHRPDHRHRIVAGRGRIAGAVGEEEAVRRVRHHLVEASRSPAARSPARRHRRGCGRCCAWSRSRSRRRAAALSDSRSCGRHSPAQRPAARRPSGTSGGTTPPWRGPCPRGPARRAPSRAAPRRRTCPSARWAITPFGAPWSRIRRVSARVSTPASPIRPFAFIQSSKPCALRKLLGCGHVVAHHAAERPGIVRLQILVIGADIADMGEGEGDDLRGIGGIGHHLLIAGHRGVEADLADRLALRRRSPGPRSIAPSARTNRPVAPSGAGLGLASAMVAGTPSSRSAMSLRPGR